MTAKDEDKDKNKEIDDDEDPDFQPIDWQFFIQNGIGGSGTLAEPDKNGGAAL